MPVYRYTLKDKDGKPVESAPGMRGFTMRFEGSIDQAKHHANEFLVKVLRKNTIRAAINFLPPNASLDERRKIIANADPKFEFETFDEVPQNDESEFGEFLPQGAAPVALDRDAAGKALPNSAPNAPIE